MGTAGQGDGVACDIYHLMNDVIAKHQKSVNEGRHLQQLSGSSEKFTEISPKSESSTSMEDKFPYYLCRLERITLHTMTFLLVL